MDLCNLKSIEDGRIEYDRAKTNRHYSIKVEPEAMAIIEKYRGKDWLINPLDTNKNYRSYYMRLSHGLRTLKETLNALDDGIKIDELTTYWARHSWATVAASLDIPKETIAAALGHGGNTVTDIYIDFDQKKVDEANRKVLDYVFGAPEKKTLTNLKGKVTKYYCRLCRAENGARRLCLTALCTREVSDNSDSR